MVTRLGLAFQNKKSFVRFEFKHSNSTTKWNFHLDMGRVDVALVPHLHMISRCRAAEFCCGSKR
jgi:hypothetical protein